jgi:Ca2+-binding RTX toxin-like protein
MRKRRRVALVGIALSFVLAGTLHAATVVGTSSRDVIRGTANADELYGLSGNDRMYGASGTDLLIGSFGNDLLVGGPSSDVLLGGPGGDRLDGSAGRDTMIGGNGSDLLVAKDGARDFVDCGLGKDQIIRDPFDHIENCEKRRVKPPAGGSGGSGGSGGGGSPPPPPPSGNQRVKLTVKAGHGGSVTSTPDGIACPGRCTATFAAGTRVTLRANPSKSWAFARWGGSCSGKSATCAVTLGQDRWARAMFHNPTSSPPRPPSPQPPPPPSPPPPSPPPNNGGSVVTTSNWTCDGHVNLDLVKVTMQSGGDAVTLGAGCTGRIGRIEIDTWREDGIKIQNNASNAAHDLVIGGGYVKCHDVSGGAHQDGVQAMGGARVTFRNLSIDCLGNSNFFVNRAGSGSTTPTDIVCEGCFLGPKSSTTIRINEAIRSGARNSTFCPGRNMTDFWGDPSSINSNNTVLSRTDARCR